MIEDYGQTVSPEALERALADLQATVKNRQAGLFGPASMLWRVDREAALFLCAGSALMMQLAHPWVAFAIAQHSRSLADPVGRFHRTFSIMFSFVFGTADQAFSAARRLHRRHAAIVGTLPENAGPFPRGSGYAANTVPALLWVHATLVEAALVAHDAVLPPLTADERDRYIAETARMAALFGIPAELAPRDWQSHRAYVDAMLASETLTVTGAARDIARQLLSGSAGPPVPERFRTITAQLLGPRLRAGFALPFGAREERSAKQSLTFIRKLYPRLPPALRTVGPYREAQERLRGRANPSVTTRCLNRFWIGSSALPS